jgi:subtilase family serine protease
MRRLRLVPYFAASAVLLAFALHAQVSSVAQRIVSPIDERSLTTLKGNVAPVARAEFDQGKAPASTQLRSVQLVLSRSKEQQAALESLMAAQLDKNSPEYHHWLTPDEFDRRFGAADSDIAAITAWLQSQGLTVETARSNGSSIALSGTVRQIENAFHISIHAFQREGIDYVASVTEPKIPAALAPVVVGVAGLSTYAPKPHMVKGRSGMFTPGAGFADNDSPSQTPRPELTTKNSFLWITPADAATMYDTPNSYNVSFASGTSYTGHGVTIGIGGDSAIKASTVVNYRTRFLNGDTTPPIFTNVDGSAVTCPSTDPTCGEDEAYIDNELAGGLAPGAAIHYYAADQSTGVGLPGVINKVIQDNSVDIFSLSFGLCEFFFSNSTNQSIYNGWNQMAVQGIAVTVSTGDSGAAGCDSSGASSAQDGLQVNGLASTPFNIAVGGTDTYGLLSGFSTYANNNAGPGNFYRSALSYIPEATWNNSTTVNGLLANNVPRGLSTSDTGIAGGSGGVSSCSTQNATTGDCVSGYPKPSWQRGPGVPSDNARDLPDVSLMAGNGYDSATWLICTDDPVTGTAFVNDCSTQSDTHFYFAGFGGTSTAAPAFAGILALVQESRGGPGHRLGGDAVKTLYDLFNGSHASAVFHDTTQGNISVYCTAGTPNCATNTAGYPFLTGYDTGTGYDLATGMGSVDATNLVKYWSAGIGTAAATVTVTPSSNSITVGENLTVNVTVSGSSGMPTGTVSVTGGGYTSSSVALDNTGKASVLIPAHSLAAGSVTLTAAYSGDATYASTTGTGSVTVTPLITPTVTATPNPASIYTDQSSNVHVTVTGTSGVPTGTATLSGNGWTSPATTLSAGSATINIPGGKLAPGSAVTAAYSGDTVYGSATAPVAITVLAKITPTVTVTPAGTSVDTAQPLDVTVQVAGTTAGGTPTGSVILSGSSYNSASTALSGGSASFTIPANTFTATGALTLTAKYAGDTVYNTATGTSSVTVNAPYSVAGTTPAAVSAGGTATSTVTVKSDGAYAGTVAMSCGLTSSPSGAQNVPTCSVTSGSSLTFDATHTSQTSTVTINTTAPTTASLDRRGLPGWTATGGAVLAVLFFIGMPARRRSWRALLGLLVLIAALGSLSGCGGSSSTTGGGNPGTTAGTYTFTVTGAGTPLVTPAPTATVTLTVN